ncbi:MAG: PIG-L family deacetylase, partial [Nanoarchaeota archaeon]
MAKTLPKKEAKNGFGRSNSHKALGTNPAPETVVVFGAHSDDFVIGAGGTIAKYQQEGKKILAVVFSYGESS